MIYKGKYEKYKLIKIINLNYFHRNNQREKYLKNALKFKFIHKNKLN